MRRTLSRLAPLILFFALPAASASVFDVPEPTVVTAPSQASHIVLAEGARVVDFDVSPVAPLAAVLAAKADGAQEILTWKIGQVEAVQAAAVPPGLQARTIVWHPRGDAIFLSGTFGAGYAIFRLDRKGNAWQARQIYSAKGEIRRLVPGPRPYYVGFDEQRRESIPAYRLFFGLRSPGGSYSLRSVTEDGRREYQVVGPKEGFTRFPKEDAQPSELAAPSALPAAFHPAGHLLLWQDEKRCYQVARYDRDHWSRTAPLAGREVCSGSFSVTPNGAALLHWTPGVAGVEVLTQQGKLRTRQAAEYAIDSTPSSTADGRGIVATTKTDNRVVLNYIPIDVPLADTVNAWMFVESAQDAELFARGGGLFRARGDDQLYQLYDTESYYCGRLDESTPTRPYYVTTDVFWELFAAAYEGIFILRERQSAMPAFWKFVADAEASLRTSAPQSRWAQVFAALAALKRSPEGNDEARRILAGSGSQFSPLLAGDFDYGELKPRGHYTANPESQLYFRAFRYLTRVSALGWSTDELAALPPAVKRAALAWIAAYREMIAPSRSPLLWQDAAPTPVYVHHPLAAPVLFPLSWGFDNETLFSTVFHQDLPAAEQIRGPGGQRFEPAALDVAAALGSRFARSLLSGEIEKYPALDAALNELAQRYPHADLAASPNLYQRWIDALAEQWSDATPSPGGAFDDKLWRVKRLQTGLASWATLRHATVLVNERISAECGEGGFEFIVMRPPRGYVEPDPKTFENIAGLFDAASRMVRAAGDPFPGTLPMGEDAESHEALKQGLLRRLGETAAKARLFAAIATKEQRGEELTPREYEEILYVGRVAEHHFLVFKSLANKDLALSTPNPIPKIADVSDVLGRAPYLMAAVGRPLEWDHNVPFYGRHQIVKGAVYSFYEFSSPQLLTDAEWLKRLPAEPRPSWVAPFIAATPLPCPARDPF